MDLQELQKDVEENLVKMLNDPEILKRFDISEEEAQHQLSLRPEIRWVKKEETDEG